MTSSSSADMVYDMDRWWVREWQKIQPEKDLYRYYRLTLQQNLWGEWELIKSWGRIGQRPTRVVALSVTEPEHAEILAAAVAKARKLHGYLPDGV
ncbi:MAG: WGR domain-containing protein [Acidithiobacillus ferrivorans]